MSPAPIPRELLTAIASAGNDLERAADFIEEHILHRRAKGDSLYDVSNSLLELEAKLPARSAPAIRQAQYATNVPPASDLTPPSGPSHRSSASPQTVLAFLVSEPAPAVQHAREVILEYVLAREARLRDKNPGRGGKGTLGRDGFEEIAARLGEIEDGLRGKGPLAAGVATAAGRRGAPTPAPGTPDDELSPTRQLGLALVLSLRMLLSYFTLVDLGRQLLSQTPQDAVRTLVQHIRRRVPGEGRFSVGRELEYVESLTLHRRPTLRPAFRSARLRTHLPQRALYPVSLPAPSKSACIKLLNAFIRDVDQVGPSAAASYMQSGTHGQQALPSSRKKSSPLVGGASPGSPVSPLLSPGSPVRNGNGAPPPTDPTPIESYTLELVSEWLTREKREYMFKNKWAKAGREQLSKDLMDIETALCVTSKGMPTPHSGVLLPVFLLLRRTYSLPATPLPPAIVGSAYDMLPMPPEPDSVPLAEPTVSSTTASLYVNPRLPDREALDIIEELLESEREKGLNANVSEEKTLAWLLGQVDQVQKRFPDGSYETVFEQARMIAAHPRAWPDASTTSAFPSHRLVSGSGHRRSKSSAVPSPVNETAKDKPPVPAKSHMRSASLPMRASAASELSAPRSTGDAVSPALSSQAVRDSESSVNDPDSGSEVDSEFARRVAPVVDSLGLTNHSGATKLSPTKTINTSPTKTTNTHARDKSTASQPSHLRERSNTSSNHNHGGKSSRDRAYTAPSNRQAALERAKSDARERYNERYNGKAMTGTIRSKPPMLNLSTPYHEVSTELSDFMEAEPAPRSKPPKLNLSKSKPYQAVSTELSDFMEAEPESRSKPPKLNLSKSKPYQAVSTELSDFMEAEPEPEPPVSANSVSVSSVGGTSESGWWDVISASDSSSPAPRRSPRLPDERSQPESPLATTHLPPGAESPLVDGASMTLNTNGLAPHPEPASATTPRADTTMALPPMSTSPGGLNLDFESTTGPFGTITGRGPPPPALTAAEAEHAAAAAAAVAATEAKLTGSAPSSTASTPRTTPTLIQTARVEAGPPVPRMDSDEQEQLEEFGAVNSTQVTTPKSAPLSGSRPGWHGREPSESRMHGTLPLSAGATRPPPVPLTIDRPSFPSLASGPLSSKDPAPAPDHAPLSTTTKLKLGSFGRSMSLSARHVMGRSKDKEDKKEKERLARKNTTMRPGAITNNPERWNRDMVVGIMGPPVERK